VSDPGASAAGLSLAQRFRSRSAVYFAGDAVVKLLSIGLFLITVESFGPELFGRLARVAALLGIAAAVGDFGLATLLLKRVGGLPEGTGLPPGERRRFTLLRAAFTTAMAAACVAYLGLAGATDDVLLAAAGGGAGLLVRVVPDLIGSVLRGRGQASRDLLVRSVSGVAFVAAGLAVVLHGHGVAGFGAAWLFAAVVAAATAWFAAVPLPAGDAEEWPARDILRRAVPFGVLALCTIVYFRIDTEMVAVLCGDVETGIYGTAYRLFEACLLVPSAAAAALIPLYAGAFEKRKLDQIRRLAADGCHHMAFLGGLGGVVLFAAGPQAIELVFRAELAPAGDVFRILVWAVPVVFVSCVTASLIAAGPSPQVNTKIAIAMAVENVLLNLYAIPRWGAAGAAATTLLTEATGLVVNLIWVRRNVGRFPLFRHLLRAAVAAAAGVAACRAVQGWLGALAGGAAFVVVWLVAGVASPREPGASNA
jgi:PST family polysaccharide transporter